MLNRRCIGSAWDRSVLGVSVAKRLPEKRFFGQDGSANVATM